MQAAEQHDLAVQVVGLDRAGAAAQALPRRPAAPRRSRSAAGDQPRRSRSSSRDAASIPAARNTAAPSLRARRPVRAPSASSGPHKRLDRVAEVHESFVYFQRMMSAAGTDSKSRLRQRGRDRHAPCRRRPLGIATEIQQPGDRLRRRLHYSGLHVLRRAHHAHPVHAGEATQRRAARSPHRSARTRRAHRATRPRPAPATRARCPASSSARTPRRRTADVDLGRLPTAGTGNVTSRSGSTSRSPRVTQRLECGPRAISTTSWPCCASRPPMTPPTAPAPYTTKRISAPVPFAAVDVRGQLTATVDQHLGTAHVARERDARNRHTSATSVGSAMRPSGTVAPTAAIPAPRRRRRGAPARSRRARPRPRSTRTFGAKLDRHCLRGVEQSGLGRAVRQRARATAAHRSRSRC